MAETEEELQALMSVVDRYGHRWRFQVNPGKCGLLKFRHDGGKLLPTSELRLGDKIVQWVSKYKYLGVELHNGHRSRISGSVCCDRRSQQDTR